MPGRLRVEEAGRLASLGSPSSSHDNQTASTCQACTQRIPSIHPLLSPRSPISTAPLLGLLARQKRVVAWIYETMFFLPRRGRNISAQGRGHASMAVALGTENAGFLALKGRNIGSCVALSGLRLMGRLPRASLCGYRRVALPWAGMWLPLSGRRSNCSQPIW